MATCREAFEKHRPRIKEVAGWDYYRELYVNLKYKTDTHDQVNALFYEFRAGWNAAKKDNEM